MARHGTAQHKNNAPTILVIKQFLIAFMFGSLFFHVFQQIPLVLAAQPDTSIHTLNAHLYIYIDR